MLESIKNFYNKMLGRNKQTNKSFIPDIKLPNNQFNNHHNNLNLNNMETLQFVIPGHYALKETLSDGKNVKMIRVIGADKNAEGFWLIVDENHVGKTKRIHESTILNDYVPLKVDTPQHYKKIKNILGNIEDVKPKEHIDLSQKDDKTIIDDFTKEYNTNDSPLKVDNTPKQIIKEQPQIQQKEYSFDIGIVNKCNIENINNELYKKHGEGYIQISDEPINFNLQLKLGYDISKLKQLIDLLNLDVEEISDYLSSQIITKINLKRIISNRLFDMLSGNLEPSKIVEVQKENIEKQHIESSKENKSTGLPTSREEEILRKLSEKKQENTEEKINSGLKELDNLLANYI